MIVNNISKKMIQNQKNKNTDIQIHVMIALFFEALSIKEVNKKVFLKLKLSNKFI